MNVAQVVDNGFNVLTREQRDVVDLEELNIQSYHYCIIGQIFPDEFFSDACQKLAEKQEIKFVDSHSVNEFAYSHGFDVNPDCGFSFATLETEWVRRLSEERRSIWDVWTEANQSER